MTRHRPILLAAAAVVTAVVFTIAVRYGASTADPPPTATLTPGSTTPLQAPAAAATPPEPTVGGDDASPAAEPYSHTAAARRAWEPVVVGFGTNFTRTNPTTPGDWQTRLAAYVTDDIHTQLATVDQHNVPAGRYLGYDVLDYGDDKLIARIDYTTNWSLAVYVITDGNHWRIYQYDRYEQ